MKDFLIAAQLLLGTGFIVLAAVGVLRMPDVMMRMQATSKAITLGLGCLMLGLALNFGTPGATLRAGLVVAFFFVTAPVAAHIIARAAYMTGIELWKGSVTDALRGRYDRETRRLGGECDGS